MAQSELSGSLKYMSLGTLLSINCNERQTARIVIEKNGDQGEIFIEDGNIVHAQLDSEEGEPAFHRIFGLTDGNFSTYPNEHSPQKSISQNWSNLILEAARRLDEDNEDDAEEIDWANFDLNDLGVKTVQQDEPDEKAGLIKKSLKQLKGVNTVRILSPKNQLIEGESPETDPTAANFVETITHFAESLQPLLEVEQIQQIQVRNEQTRLIINDGQYVLFLTALKEVLPQKLLKDILKVMKRYR